MTKKSKKNPHKYDVDFLFENENLSIWQEILRWERDNQFTGKRSRIWSKSEHDVYFYYLIENQQRDFIAEIPVTEQFHQEMKLTHQNEQLLHYAARHANNDNLLTVLRPFIDHLFSHTPDSFYTKNNHQLSPIMIAIHYNNLPFIMLIKHILCDAQANLELLTPDFMTHFFKDLYTWAKSVTKNQAILSQLYTMGAICYAHYDEKEITNDFIALFPDLNPKQAPYSSPELFLKAALETNEGSSSQSTTNLLAASKQYWTLLLESALLSHNRAGYLAKKMQALLSALEGTDPEKAPSDEYYDLVDTLLFLIKAEESVANHEQWTSYFKGLNPLRILLSSLHSNSDDQVNGVALLIALIFYITTIVTLSIFKDQAHHEWKSSQRALQENYPDCGKVLCWYHVKTWDCCHGTNISDWCDQWLEDYKSCSHKADNHYSFDNAVFSFGLFGFIGSCFIVPLVVRIINAIVGGLSDCFGQYHFISNNKDEVHNALKSLLKILKTQAPLLLEESPVSEKLNLLDKEPYDLTQEEFFEAIQAMTQFLANYHSQAVFLPPTLRISDQMIQEVINNLPTQNLVASSSPKETKKLLRLSESSADIDIEAGAASTPLLANERQGRQFCIIL